ncbi:MAG: DUF1801 domain-containing protein [Bacteroidota bacterium]
MSRMGEDMTFGQDGTGYATEGTGYSDDELAALRPLTAESSASTDVPRLAKPTALDIIDAYPEPDRTLAQQVHAIVRAHAPQLVASTWRGMPAYTHDGAVVCFFSGASQSRERYASLVFTGSARLDEGSMWPTAFALTDMTPETTSRIASLVRLACGIGEQGDAGESRPRGRASE